MLGGPVRQYFTSEKTGSVSEAVINFGGNISNKFYFGVNLGIVNVWYNYNEFYSESALDSRNFNSGFLIVIKPEYVRVSSFIAGDN